RAWRAAAAISLADGAFQVHPGDEIQDALQRAAADPSNKVVHVHAGEYRPSSKRQALIWFNRAHDGIRLVAIGPVTLNAANPGLVAPSDRGYPAAVNHVVYLGDGVSSNTVVDGFRITGANGFLTREQTAAMEPNKTIPRNYFFYSDGGAIKIFGRSYPRLRNLEIVGNFTRPCGAGISIQHQGYSRDLVDIENCEFRDNRAQGTGSAVDLLAGSAARLRNCLFVANVSNTGEDEVAKNSGERPFVNNGVLTVFWNSRAVVERCTFAGNRNGADDMGGTSEYRDCVFAGNTLDAGLKGYPRYALAVNAGGRVVGCRIEGTVHDVRKVVSPSENLLEPPPPRFDETWVPRAPEYASVGYRPFPAPWRAAPPSGASSSVDRPADSPGLGHRQ
ncbi:MAG: right-handed parallel beta-helix repeat-containing protein, partial [Verrucomicrobiales bacterium]|nr:right-handed parallel beta-helix repeat-containing protein [Verrucomicrobiales bacterium]